MLMLRDLSIPFSEFKDCQTLKLHNRVLSTSFPLLFTAKKLKTKYTMKPIPPKIKTYQSSIANLLIAYLGPLVLPSTLIHPPPNFLSKIHSSIHAAAKAKVVPYTPL